jgi:hypothetical protein
MYLPVLDEKGVAHRNVRRTSDSEKSDETFGDEVSPDFQRVTRRRRMDVQLSRLTTWDQDERDVKS